MGISEGTAKIRQPASLEEEILQSWHVQAAIQRLGERGLSRETAEETARQFFRSARSSHKPLAMFISAQASKLYLLLSFSNRVTYTGLERAVEMLEKGKVAVVSDHASYGTIGDWFYFFSENNIGNVYYGAGENVPHVNVKIPLIGKPLGSVLSKILGAWVHNSGAIYLKRSFSGKSDALFHAVLAAYESYLLQNGAVVHNYTGRGRQKEGFVEQLNLSATPGILQGAEWIIPASVTYSTIPEDVAFSQALAIADGKAKRRKENKSSAASFLTALKLINLKKILMWGDEGFGEAYVNFGEPVQASHYAPNGAVSDEEKEDFHRDVTARIVRLVTLTPNSAIAVALLDRQTTSWFDIAAYASSLVREAKQAGVHLAIPLTKPNIDEALSEAFNYFVRKGAVQKTADYSYRLKDQRLIVFYANTIRATLNSFMQPKPAQLSQLQQAY